MTRSMKPGTPLTATMFALSMLTLSGCKTSDSHVYSSYEQTGRVPFLVLSGGFGSCNSINANEDGDLDPRTMEIHANLKQMLGELQASGIKETPTAVSCFPFALVGAAENVYYVLSDDPDRIRYGRRQEFYSEVNRLAGSLKDPVTHIIGHSYGGWNAMQLTMAADSKVNLGSLTTIDAISPVKCRPTNIFIQDTNGNGGQSGCQEAPSDVTSADRLSIAKKSGAWTNFFQTDFNVLHSSALPQAHANSHLKYDQTGSRTAHTKISTDKVVWDKIYKQVAATVVPEDDKLDDDLFLHLSEPADTSSAPDVYVAGREDLAKVRVCKGIKSECLASDRVELDFRVHSEARIQDRKVFRSTKPALIENDTVYTIIGHDSANKAVSVISLKFKQK